MTSCLMCSRWHDEPQFRIAELEQCCVMLNRDQFFTGYTFVIAKEHVTELFHLDRDRRTAVMDEVTAVASALHHLFSPDKINYELLGNMAPHMHWHLVPRFRTDPLWPRPIWSEPHAEMLLTDDGYAELTERIRFRLLQTSKG